MDAMQEGLTVARVKSWLRSGRARAIRERAGMSQAEAAKMIGTDHWQISRWEGRKSVPDIRTLLKLAEMYDGLEEIIRAEETPADREIPA
jgi:transcriptional regulator with XRE-family HTH domain